VRICYVLPSPTFGMHQYTADLANRLATAGHQVDVVTTTRAPRDRYVARIAIHTPVDTRDTGFSTDSLRYRQLRRLEETILDLDPDLVHFSGPHMWHLALLSRLKRHRLPTLHTLHDLDPHSGSGYGALLRIWNRQVIQSADYIMVHGETYYERLMAMRVPPERVISTPLMHLFIGGVWVGAWPHLAAAVEYQPWALFFGRLKPYKGLEYLISACAMMGTGKASSARVVVAGPGDLSTLWAGSLPDRLEVHNYLISDEEAMDLFCRCGLLVLPYVDATQSALIAAAYYFRKPVVVTRTGALPEYVEDDRTGRIVEPNHPASLARTLEEMLNDRAGLERMGAAGRAWYDTRRATEEQVLTEAYTRIAETRIRAPRRALLSTKRY
jgi:glycosyltransferase involved in cell wall biosynthesis